MAGIGVTLDEANLPYNFDAPMLTLWWPALSLQAMEECAMLARNASDVASSVVVMIKVNPTVFAASAAATVQSGVRLRRLLEYFFEVCRYYRNVLWPYYGSGQGNNKEASLYNKMVLYETRLSFYLNRLPRAWVDAEPAMGFAPFQPTTRSSAGLIPAEPMMELLGQLGIWVAIQRNNTNIMSENGMMALLRSLTTGFAAGDPSPYSPDAKKMGMCKCIFATQLMGARTVAEANILLGSTGPCFNDNIDDFFHDARRERFRKTSIKYDMELMKKWEKEPTYAPGVRDQDTYRNFEVMQDVFEISNRDHRTKVSKNVRLHNTILNNPLVPRALPPGADLEFNQNKVTLMMTAGLRKRFDDPVNHTQWHPFDHTDQIARSHFVMPGTDGSKTFFSPIPRCVKCRINHAFRISTETQAALREYTKMNIPLGCAEDLVHAKLRTLYPNDRAGAGEIDRSSSSGSNDSSSSGDSGSSSSTGISSNSSNNTNTPANRGGELENKE